LLHNYAPKYYPDCIYPILIGWNIRYNDARNSYLYGVEGTMFISLKKSLLVGIIKGGFYEVNCDNVCSINHAPVVQLALGVKL